jgi:SRSO17 transposase
LGVTLVSASRTKFAPKSTGSTRFAIRSVPPPGAAHTLIVARNVLDPTEIKYFLSNLVLDGQAVTLEWLLWVAFSRWPIERCFEIAKGELGMDHFEMRSWRGIHRHWYLTQVCQLFCARVHQQLREKKTRRKACI